MAKVTDRLEAMRGLTADAYGETWIDDLAADYEADVADAVGAATADSAALQEGATAKLQESEATIAELQQVITALKSQNYDLLTAVGTPAPDDDEDDGGDDEPADDEDPTAGFFDNDDE